MFNKMSARCFIFAIVSQICDFGLARLEEPHESAVMTQEVRTFPPLDLCQFG